MKHLSKVTLALAGFTLLTPLAFAAEQDGQSATTDPVSNLAYIGKQGRVGIGYDTKTHLRGDVYWIFSEKDLAAWIGEGWASGSAGGLKLSYNWVPGGKQGLANTQNPSVRKLFAAIDQNETHDQKITLGGGAERESLFYGGYFSAGISGKRTVSDTITSSSTQTITGTETDGRPYTQDIVTTTSSVLTERPYDYGVGARIGKYFQQPLVRLTGGLDYEWGRDSNQQTTISARLEKFFYNTPHSISVNAELYDRSGPLVTSNGDKRLFFMYHYEFTPAGTGSDRHMADNGAGQSNQTYVDPDFRGWRPERPYKMVQHSATAPAPAVDAQPTVEKRMVKTTVSMNSDAFFEFDRSRLLPAAKEELDKVIEVLRSSGYSGNIHLTGHTCNIGTEKYNQGLSERRANSVKKYLADHGIPADAIIAEGMGELNPTYPNTREMRPKNRRVDLEFVTYEDKMEEVTVPAAAPMIEAAPAKVEWVREYIDTEPAWMHRALHDTMPHKESVNVYRQQETSTTVTAGAKQYVLNHPPIVVDDIFSVPTNAPSVLNVLANDSDPDGDPLTIVSFTQPSVGTVSSDGKGNLIFTPSGYFPVNHFASATFDYTISDGKGGTATGMVTLIDP